MKLKFFLLLTLALSIFSVDAAAQTEPQKIPKVISGGVINGKATNLVRPSYPKEASAAKVGGAVLVQVEVDEDGNVVSAATVQGHPLLAQASEQAARQSKFSPTMLSGQRVRVRGVIVYNFVLPMAYFQIGYELALAQKSRTPEAIPLSSITGTMPRTWVEEQTGLKKLEAYRLEKPVEKPIEKPVVEKEPVKPPNKAEFEAAEKNEGKAYSEGNLYRAEPLKSSAATTGASSANFTVDNQKPEAVEILSDVQSKLETRIRPNVRVHWLFQVGRVLGSLAAEIESADQRRSNFAQLNGLLNVVPSNIPEDFMNKFRDVAEFSKMENFDTKSREKLLALLKELRESRIE